MYVGSDVDGEYFDGVLLLNVMDEHAVRYGLKCFVVHIAVFVKLVAH